jgi:hypothetical protein
MCSLPAYYKLGDGRNFMIFYKNGFLLQLVVEFYTLCKNLTGLSNFKIPLNRGYR